MSIKIKTHNSLASTRSGSFGESISSLLAGSLLRNVLSTCEAQLDRQFDDSQSSQLAFRNPFKPTKGRSHIFRLSFRLMKISARLAAEETRSAYCSPLCLNSILAGRIISRYLTQLCLKLCNNNKPDELTRFSFRVETSLELWFFFKRKGKKHHHFLFSQTKAKQKSLALQSHFSSCTQIATCSVLFKNRELLFIGLNLKSRLLSSSLARKWQQKQVDHFGGSTFDSFHSHTSGQLARLINTPRATSFHSGDDFWREPTKLCLPTNWEHFDFESRAKISRLESHKLGCFGALRCKSKKCESKRNKNERSNIKRSNKWTNKWTNERTTTTTTTVVHRLWEPEIKRKEKRRESESDQRLIPRLSCERYRQRESVSNIWIISYQVWLECSSRNARIQRISEAGWNCFYFLFGFAFYGQWKLN